jgi:large subunit ribosomal protein L25
MPEIVVAAESRTETGKNVNRRLRAKGLIPGVLYGAAKQPVPVAVSPHAIASVLRSASGSNTLFDLDLDGSKKKVILKEFQMEPLKGRLLHADFFEVALDRSLEVRVPVELHGTPVGVKTQGGILDFVTRELEVECLPMDIPEKIEVDVTALELGKHLRASDLSLPAKLKLLTDPGVVVVHVVAPRAEEVAPVAAEAAEVVAPTTSEPEVIKKGRPAEEGAEEKPEKKPEKGDKGERREKK